MRRSGFLNSAQEPVVKSCRRVPTASTTSASSASALAAAVPVTPTAPMIERMVVRQARLAGLRLADRNAVLLGEIRQRLVGARNRARRRRR